MQTKTLIISALRAIKHHKVRSLLTMLGIIIGISAIIATLAIGYGTQAKMRNQVAAVGNNYVELFTKGLMSTDGAVELNRYKPTKKLTTRDLKAIQEQCKHIRFASPLVYGHGVTKYNGSPIVSDIKGGNESLIPILNRSINRGQNFTHYHIHNNARVAVLGYQASKDLFKKQNPISKSVEIKGVQFTVIGVLKKIDNHLGSRDPNLDVFIPYTAAKRHIRRTMSININAIIMSAKSLNHIPSTVRQLYKIMRMRHSIEPGQRDDFGISDQASLFKAAEETSNTFNLFLLIVASISLLVGGIGVMNIMLVSVTERTTEIGIRMALGARTHTILKQFLIESIVLCFIGGLIGIGLGIIAPFAIQALLGIPALLHVKPIIISCVTIIFIGITFGFYPAFQASRLNPVEALTKQ